MSNEPKILSVQTLKLGSFRNYDNLSIEFEPSPVVITGKNGAGKTNILEALSLLSPGRGIRNTKLSDIDNQSTNAPWELYAFVNGTLSKSEIIINKDLSKAPEIDKRVAIINGSKAKSKNELAKIFSVIWLTPQMDNLFTSSSSDRRRFFDRLVYNFDTEHATRISKYEYFMRERNRLLRERNFDPAWISVLEKKMSEVAVSIAASRVEAQRHLNLAVDESDTSFPKAIIKISGELEKLVDEMPALRIEEYYLSLLKNYRELDMNSGRTNVGPHKSDLIVTHAGKNQVASYCSTGEQKSLLISMILADAKAKFKWTNTVPILLLDEIAAHLDDYRKDALFDELYSIKCQFFITGVDHNSFDKIKHKAQFFTIDQNKPHHQKMLES